MNDEVGEAIFILKVDSAQAKKDIGNFKTEASSAMGETEKSAQSLSDGFGQLTDAVANLATAHYALSGTASAISNVVEAYNQYESAMNGVAAVARGTGQDIAASITAVKDISAGGLISQSDAAAAIKNLEAYGYSVEEATQLISVMADAAAYNRQANYSLSEAVRVTTEGIRMENSVLSDAAGINKNIAKMQQEYAASLGKTTDALTDAEKRQAVYNGFMQEGAIFAGNASSYSQTLAGSQQQLDTAISDVSQSIGAMFAQFSPVISSLAEWIDDNKQLVATLATTVGILTAAGGLIASVKLAFSAITTLRSAMTTLGIVSRTAQGGLIGLAVAAASIGAAVLVANGINSMADSMEQATDSAEDLGATTKEVGDTSITTAKKVASLQEQLAKLDRDYARDLKKIAVSHEDNLKTLTQQIEEANIDYRRAIDERMADFNVTLAKEERSHQEMVDELMTQLNFLQRYNNDYNKQKLAQVQFALAKEQRLYEEETAKQKAEIELQNEVDRQKLEKKLASLQQELDDEMAFMDKHRDALASVRDLILNDEIENLNERYREQRANYAKQVSEAHDWGVDTANAFDAGYEAAQKTLSPDVDTDLCTEGAQAAATFNDGLLSAMYSFAEDGGIGSVFWKFLLGEERFNRWSSGQGLFYGGWADGGYTGRGAVDEVAGVVHKGEYVVPASQVDQNTGEPKLGSVQNITINLSGVLATSAQAKRDLAQELVKAINQVNQARIAA